MLTGLAALIVGVATLVTAVAKLLPRGKKKPCALWTCPRCGHQYTEKPKTCPVCEHLKREHRGQ